MVLSEYLSAIRAAGIPVTEAQVRHAMKNERLPRPRINGARQYDYSTSDVDAAVQFFGPKLELAACK